MFQDLAKCELSPLQIVEFKSYAQTPGLKVGVSFLDQKISGILAKKCSILIFFKVPSAECSNTELLELLLSFKKDVLVSSGGHLPHEIEKTLFNFKDKITILHYIANYPKKNG